MTGRQPPGPLQGIRVLDLTRILAGPYATMQLGDLGADIIKIEPPKGDDTRQWGPPWIEGESAYYMAVNRNKRSVRLDLSTPAAKKALKQLVKDADVLIENFKLGTMEKWGLGYEDCLRSLNPELVYCSITGYGRTGPNAHLPGYDPVIEAMAGLMSITGEADGPPMKVGVAIVDVLTGCQVAFAVTAALFHRMKTGEGQRVDLSLFECALSGLANQAAAYLMSGKVPTRHGNAHPAIVPFEVFSTRDGPVMVCVGNDRQFQKLSAILKVPELAQDERFTTNPLRVQHREILTPLLQERFLCFTSAEITAQADEAGLPIAPVNSLDKVFEHPQVQARDMLIEINHPTAGSIRQVGFPIKMQQSPASLTHPPPLLGEHTKEVLLETGLSPSEIEVLLGQVEHG